ncbi:MAG: hypothetical protein H2172_02200 [Opitutus sp.]|nr:hypothetical protein [Opitutus sp.]MCS6275651.1 hypothetical protein [Opitutus sp.]MCS6278148.1 hypothetical protein [Opitutus sp.]MCS6299258.1 hypothetical protein [Opitutus sp.]
MKYIKVLLTCLVSIATTSLWGAADPAVVAAGAKYQVAGKSVVDMVIAQKVDLATVTAKVDILVAEGTVLAQAYIKAYPAGAKLLNAVIANIPEMKKLGYDELLTEWHDLGYFAKPGHEVGLDLKSEDNEHFTDPIHAIVHPLLVLKAAQSYDKDKKESYLKDMKEEMSEGIEQSNALVTHLSK